MPGRAPQIRRASPQGIPLMHMLLCESGQHKMMGAILGNPFSSRQGPDFREARQPLRQGAPMPR